MLCFAHNEEGFEVRVCQIVCRRCILMFSGLLLFGMLLGTASPERGPTPPDHGQRVCHGSRYATQA